MGKDDVVEFKGIVEETLPAAAFQIRLENGHLVRAHLSGRMRMNRIRLMVGDKVKVEFSPYDLTRGRVVYRY